MSDPGKRTAPLTAPADVRTRPANRQDYRDLLTAIQANGQALKAGDVLAGRVDAKVTAIDVKVSAVDAKAVGSRLSARLEDLDAKLIARVEALSSQVKANRDAIRDLGARFEATETAVSGLDVRLGRVEKALAAIARAVDAKIG